MTRPEVAFGLVLGAARGGALGLAASVALVLAGLPEAPAAILGLPLFAASLAAAIRGR